MVLYLAVGPNTLVSYSEACLWAQLPASIPEACVVRSMQDWDLPVDMTRRDRSREHQPFAAQQSSWALIGPRPRDCFLPAVDSIVSLFPTLALWPVAFPAPLDFATARLVGEYKSWTRSRECHFPPLLPRENLLPLLFRRGEGIIATRTPSSRSMHPKPDAHQPGCTQHKSGCVTCTDGTSCGLCDKIDWKRGARLISSDSRSK